ncbi:MAG: type I-E CRISPR-associated protein Cas6/Cse3/CasE [Acidobacteriota bacterium]
MYLSRIELRDDAGRAGAFWKRIASLDDVHRVVWSWFGDRPDRERDFLYRLEGEGSKARFFTLSERQPVDGDGLWRIESKVFQPKLAPGDRLVFSLRANPTVRKASGPAKGKRHDVVMDAKVAARAGGDERSMTELVEGTCFAWLSARAERCGFEIGVGDVRTEGYRSARFPRGRGRDDASITTVDFAGCLTVRNPGAFVDALAHGIGPAKGFGCGLMLVRRA